MSKINVFRRYQTGLTVADLFPLRSDRRCACGCEAPLGSRRRRWASRECEQQVLRHFYIIKGDQSVIRKELFRRDRGWCRQCRKRGKWEADHILPVCQGGGGCDLSNYQTLCVACHRGKSKIR